MRAKGQLEFCFLKVAAWSEHSHDYYFNLPKQKITLKQLQLTLNKSVVWKEANTEVTVLFADYKTKKKYIYRDLYKQKQVLVRCCELHMYKYSAFSL